MAPAALFCTARARPLRYPPRSSRHRWREYAGRRLHHKDFSGFMRKRVGEGKVMGLCRTSLIWDAIEQRWVQVKRDIDCNARCSDCDRRRSDVQCLAEGSAGVALAARPPVWGRWWRRHGLPGMCAQPGFPVPTRSSRHVRGRRREKLQPPVVIEGESNACRGIATQRCCCLGSPSPTANGLDHVVLVADRAHGRRAGLVERSERARRCGRRGLGRGRLCRLPQRRIKHKAQHPDLDWLGVLIESIRFAQHQSQVARARVNPYHRGGVTVADGHRPAQGR